MTSVSWEPLGHFKRPNPLGWLRMLAALVLLALPAGATPEANSPVQPVADYLRLLADQTKLGDSTSANRLRLVSKSGVSAYAIDPVRTQPSDFAFEDFRILWTQLNKVFVFGMNRSNGWGRLVVFTVVKERGEWKLWPHRVLKKNAGGSNQYLSSDYYELWVALGEAVSWPGSNTSVTNGLPAKGEAHHYRWKPLRKRALDPDRGRGASSR